MHARSLEQLRSVTTDQLVKDHDGLAKHTVIGIDYVLRELERRDTKNSTDEVVRLTRQMRTMTALITLLTLVNIALVALATGLGS